MVSWEPVDIDRDGTGDEDYEWGDNFMNDLEKRFEELRQFNKTLNESCDEGVRDESIMLIDTIEHETIEFVADQIYDKLTISFKNTRKNFVILKGIPIVEPIRNYDNFKLADDGALSYIYKRTVIDPGNINERLKSPWEIRELGVAKLRSMGSTNITDEDVQPHRAKYKKARKKLRKLDDR